MIDPNRRNFLKLGALSMGAFGVAGCNREKRATNNSQKQQEASPAFGVDLDKWKKGRGAPYQIGGQKMPGVCLLPGPEAKRNWPPKNKYKDSQKIPGMCQLRNHWACQGRKSAQNRRKPQGPKQPRTIVCPGTSFAKPFISSRKTSFSTKTGWTAG
jgi:hypothetical protein